MGEQTRIVAEVERRLSMVAELEAVVSANPPARHPPVPIPSSKRIHREVGRAARLTSGAVKHSITA